MEGRRRATGKGGNEMLKSELVAAVALAGLASTESPPLHYSVSKCSTTLRLSSYSTDEAMSAPRQCKNTYNLALNKGNADQDGQFLKPIATCSRSPTYINGTKSRDKMAEKEAKRLRRVLANRNSARQTICRRQTLYEELISKVASLALENDSLKREMDFAEKELSSLKTTNESLKSQMVESFSTKIDENRPNLQSTNMEMSKSTCPSFFFMAYNQVPPFPFMWPAFLQHQNAIQASDENKNVPNNPLYTFPCPIFYPVPNHGYGVPLISFDPRNDQIATPMSYSYTCSSSTKTAEYGFEEAKGEAASTSKNIQNIHEVPFKIQTDPPVVVKQIPSVKPLTWQPAESIPTSSSTLDTIKEMNIDLNICPDKKQADVVVVAESRKRKGKSLLN